MCDIEISCRAACVLNCDSSPAVYGSRVVRWAMFSFVESHTKMKSASSHCPVGARVFVVAYSDFRFVSGVKYHCVNNVSFNGVGQKPRRKNMLQKRLLSWPIKAKVLPRISRNLLFFNRMAARVAVTYRKYFHNLNKHDSFKKRKPKQAVFNFSILNFNLLSTT
jgi:hypothetical protein